MGGLHTFLAFSVTLALAGCTKRQPSPHVEVSCPAVDCEVVGGQVSCSAKTANGLAFVADGAELRVSQRVPVPATVSDLVLSPVCTEACAVTSSRDVYCWGEMMDDDPSKRVRVYPPTRVADLTSVRRLVMTAGSACALRDDGSVWCAGTLLGIATDPDFMASAQILVPPATAIAADFIQTCVLAADGAHCWGGHRPSHGRQLRLDRITLIEGTEAATQLRAEDGMMCVVYPDALEECWSTTPMPMD
jgi:hypothetical protein